MMKHGLRLVAVLAITVSSHAALAAEPTPEAIIDTYSAIALAGYEDSLTTATALYAATNALVEKPSEETLKAARDAWLAARIPYQQTEAFRFGNPVVDAWEGKVNAWPLDEGLIDYVDASYGTESDENGLYTANVIANEIIQIDGREVDATDITPQLLSQELQEAGGIEANVATGYHAIEFLLWGQDLNGTGPGAGNRPYTDFDQANCTGGHCDRRGAYLTAAAELLMVDLQNMVAAWGEDGDARKAAKEGGLAAILTGMGSLSFGEVAGERMKLGLLLHDPEEEHDCFSDNTYNSHYYDAQGIMNVYLGHYVRIDGTILEGPSIAELIKARDHGLGSELEAMLAATDIDMSLMKHRGETIEAYDQMIAEGNDEGNAVVQAAIDGLIEQTRGIERAVALLQLGGAVTIEQSDSLVNPDAVFQ
jgi:putative iron-regulated protein